MGIGEAPTETTGQVFPNLDMNIGANTVAFSFFRHS